MRFANPFRQQTRRFRSINAKSFWNQFSTLERLFEDRSIDKKRVYNLCDVGIFPACDFLEISCPRRLLQYLRLSTNSRWNFLQFAYYNRETDKPVVSAYREVGAILVVLKGIKLPYRAVEKNGHTIVKTAAEGLPRRSVVVCRGTGRCDDARNFMQLAYDYIYYIKDLAAGDRK